jgi:AcrR family transcriptional regulator
VIEPTGLRERKKARTHDAIADAAISLFLAHGFDQVSVTDIATAAEVSKPTLFRYFATKEDLVLHRFADHKGEPARVVRDRPTGVSPLTALHRHFRAGLDRYDPVTGLNDHPEVLAFHRLVFTTPSLAGRLTQYMLEDEEALASALGDGIEARWRAAQVLAVQRVLARANWRKLADGRSASDVHPEAVADADHAFAQLRPGIGGGSKGPARRRS